jgi:hypothetical protein
MLCLLRRTAVVSLHDTPGVASHGIPSVGRGTAVGTCDRNGCHFYFCCCRSSLMQVAFSHSNRDPIIPAALPQWHHLVCCLLSCVELPATLRPYVVRPELYCSLENDVIC